MDNNSDKLFCKNGGCGAKLGSASLAKVLSLINMPADPNLLVGMDSFDDACVYKINDKQAYVQTLDFFPPMVDDPYIFGQIAAANALSDIYAMGGEVKTALNIVCFPESNDLNILGKIISGGVSKVEEAGGVICGGHTINDESIKYGLSVTGLIDPNKILNNNSAKIGDILILTKPLGVGVINCAKTANLASKEAIDSSIVVMTSLNKYACKIASNTLGVHSCTDVTGFGLLGHLNEMLNDSSINGKQTKYAKVYSDKIKYISDAYDYAKEFLITAAGQRNRNALDGVVEFMIDDYAIEELLFDPQTSGGLLFSVEPKYADGFLSRLDQNNVNAFAFGEICDMTNMSEVFSSTKSDNKNDAKTAPNIIVF